MGAFQIVADVRVANPKVCANLKCVLVHFFINRFRRLFAEHIF